MFAKKSVRLQEVPLVRRCHSCHQLKFAIASQALIHKSSGRPYCRWLCQDCGKPRGIYPTPEFLKNLREMDEGDEVESDLKVLVRI
ncbi:hypothetical protein [Acaryochloris sp. CCMEE 5410]|uniref:hypothetical protein n=1 Tax=Acaryochloris sp. CCMEE 5410 TaxID=310037 RepID=UPI0002484710|nr:hypothetical protein [Acaryochloris sp. CCMEE 5410]KAI9129388.1 hypothetical protein ON05_035310 [Acaryochloris sp. CCMEE 5410]